MLGKLISLVTSLKLTIVCLAAAMALIFAGTIAQVHLGIWEAQQRIFKASSFGGRRKAAAFAFRFFLGVI